MATETAERRAVVRAQQLGAPLPPVDHQDPLPCPRCTSTNTKFCYYNNYNFSQPRHFCKSCRRYWTHGGTLRDVPVGGGSRKTAKRSRTSSATSSATSPTSSSGGVSMGPMLEPIPINQHATAPTTYVSNGGGGGGFTSLLSGAGGGHAGILALGGFGLGLGLDEMGFGIGRGVWAFQNNSHHHEIGGYGVHHHHHNNNNGSNSGGSASISNEGGGGVVVGLGVGSGGEEGGGGVSRNDTWQVESGEVVGFVNGDCFTSLPELAMSTTTSSGNGLK